MTKPSKKSPEMEKFLDESTQKMWGRTRTDSIKQDICVFCGGKASTFRDALSKKEFTISGLCQSCQDSTFGTD